MGMKEGFWMTMGSILAFAVVRWFRPIFISALFVLIYLMFFTNTFVTYVK